MTIPHITALVLCATAAVYTAIWDQAEAHLRQFGRDEGYPEHEVLILSRVTMYAFTLLPALLALAIVL